MSVTMIETAIVEPRIPRSGTAKRDYARDEATVAARRFAARDLDELNTAIRAGEVRHVVFHSVDDLLAAIWDEDVVLDDWRQRGVTIAFADPREAASALMPWDVAASWISWNGSRRRRQVLAGAILSAIALAAAFIANWLLR